MSGVQKEPCQDTGGGENVGYIDSGDWMDYKVRPNNAGPYQVSFRVAALGTATKTFDLLSNGVKLTSVSFTGTNGWQIWKTVNVTVSLAQGEQTLRLLATSSGFNVNYLNFTTGNPPTGILVQAESYTQMSGVILGPSGDEGGTDAVGYLDPGDWMIYGNTTIPAGTYTVRYRVARNKAGVGKLKLERPGGSPVFAQIDVPNTNGWSNYITISQTVTFNQTENGFALAVGSEGAFNINWIEFVPVSGSSLRIAETSLPQNSGDVRLNLYPNPVDDFLNVSGLSQNYSTLMLYSIDGRKQMNLALNNDEEVQLNISSLKSGIYFVRLIGKEGNTQVFRFVKK